MQIPLLSCCKVKCSRTQKLQCYWDILEFYQILVVSLSSSKWCRSDVYLMKRAKHTCYITRVNASWHVYLMCQLLELLCNDLNCKGIIKIFELWYALEFELCVTGVSVDPSTGDYVVNLPHQSSSILTTKPNFYFGKASLDITERWSFLLCFVLQPLTSHLAHQCSNLTKGLG